MHHRQDKQGEDLVEVADEALAAGIQACGPGKPFKGIGRAIHELASARGLSVSPLFLGHGIGTVFHRAPRIYHTRELAGLRTPQDFI
jgi:methionyl aminopeptidase